MRCASCAKPMTYVPRQDDMKMAWRDVEGWVSQSRCEHCGEWQDDDLPHGWNIKAAHAVLHRKNASNNWIYLKTYNFKTTAREYNHSRQLVLDELRRLGYDESYRIKVTHSQWPWCSRSAEHYMPLDGWAMEKQKQKQKQKQQKETKMGQTIKVKRGRPPEKIHPEHGKLYESTTGGCVYIVMCLNPRDPADPDFEGVVIWGEEDAKWPTGKVFPYCSKEGYKLFEGEITIGQP